MNSQRKLLLLLICLMCLVVGCGAENNTLGGNIDLTPNTDPVLLNLEVDISTSIGQLIGIKDEQSYDQIVVTSEKPVYSLANDDKFSCHIANNNVGHGFYVYGVVYIEKSIEGEWVRQTHIQAKKTEEITQWHYVGIENNADGVNSSTDGVKVEDIYPTVSAGKYRFVVFTPVGPKYGEFEVVE